MSWAPLSTTILNPAFFHGETLLIPILFEFGLGMSLGWKVWVDCELYDVGFMEML